jgi:hypothetical protein
MTKVKISRLTAAVPVAAVVTVATLVIVAFVTVPAVARMVVHRRDTVAFQNYVSTYIGGWYSSGDPGGPGRDLKFAVSRPDLVLAEGDRSCRWLAARPDVGDVDRSGKSTSSALMWRYLRETHGSGQLSRFGRMTVVAGAWDSLCWWDRREKTAPRTSGDND